MSAGNSTSYKNPLKIISAFELVRLIKAGSLSNQSIKIKILTSRKFTVKSDHKI